MSIQSNIKRKCCSNCGKIGHVRSECVEPITSLGVLAFHIDGYARDDYRMLFEKLVSDEESNKVVLKTTNRIQSTQSFSKEDSEIIQSFRERIRFVMVSRRHSLGLIEFVRGNYNENDTKSVRHLFRQMLTSEISKIARAKTFTDVATGMLDPSSRLWGMASTKFERLQSGKDLPQSLQYYLRVDPEFHTPEIGPPGGHRNNGEIAIVTAIREFREETQCQETDFQMLRAIEPLRENLVGTDGKRYRRIYHLAYMENPVELSVDPDNDGQKHEIGEVFYCSFDMAMMLIRPRHVDRKNILTRVFMFILGRILVLERYKMQQIELLKKENLLTDTSTKETSTKEPPKRQVSQS